jgi:hypothetical protein
MLSAVSVTPAARSEARRARRAAASGSSWGFPGLHRQQTLPLQLFAGELTGTADGFRLLSYSPFGRFFVMTAELHFAEEALTLHLLLQRLEGLVDIVVTNENLHAAFLFNRAIDGPNGQGAQPTGTRSCTMPRSIGTSSRHLKLHLPIGIWLPIGRNGEFGTSPFFGQLIARVSASLYTSILVCRSKAQWEPATLCVMAYV